MLTIISGGQTGADQAGLHAARRAGLPTGGTAPRLWMTEDGPAPWLADFGLVECELPKGDPPADLDSPAGRRWVSTLYPPRTLANAAAAGLTITFGNAHSAGSRLTVRCIRVAGTQGLMVPTRASSSRPWSSTNSSRCGS